MMKKRSLFVLAAAVILCAASCAHKKNGYQIKDQTPSARILPGGENDFVSYGDDRCHFELVEEGGAYAYLEALVGMGTRRSGTQGYRCAASFAERTLESLGYEVSVVTYPFPYYSFDLDNARVTRIKDGKEYKAYPIHYSQPVQGTLRGKVVRPRPILTGCFVYVHPGMFGPSLTKSYDKWKKAGALGIVREADMSPIGGKGMRHSSRAHSTSWYYSPLPGMVVENAKDLIGEEIEISHDGRITRGTGRTVVAMKPGYDRYALVTAHLDCWFTGALDDGSGSAALLETARIMKDDDAGVIFLLADSEEIGLIGSAAFAQEFDLDKISAMVELDMVSSLNNYFHDDPSKAGVMPRIITVSKGMKKTSKKHILPVPGRDVHVSVHTIKKVMGGISTDMEWFYSWGVPGVFIYTPSRFYHTEYDQIEWVPPDNLQAVAEAVASLIREMAEGSADLPPPPEVIPFDLTAEAGDGDTVTLEVRLGQDYAFMAGSGLRKTKVLVRCYFEQGFEDKVDLEKVEDEPLTWRGEYRPPRPGRWQFLGIVSRGKYFGKRWTTLAAGPGDD